MMCQMFSPQSFFEAYGGDTTEDYKFMVGRWPCYFKFGEGLDIQLTVLMGFYSLLNVIQLKVMHDGLEKVES